MIKQSDFPKYDTYGVPSQDAPVSYFYLEEARDIAEENNWDFKPHMHEHLYQMIWVEKGGGTFSAEGKKTKFKDNWVVFIVPNTLHSIVFEKDSEVYSLYFTHDFMNVGYLGNMLQNFMGNVAMPMFKDVNIPEDKKQFWSQLFYNLKYEFENPNSLGHNASIKSWLALLLTQLVRMKDAQYNSDENHNSMRSEQTTNKFIDLLEKNYKQQHRVEFYANKMNISMDTLNNHISAVMKRTVGKVIKERIVLEAKRQLIYSDKTVNQVSYLLNFEDDSYFIRFFKREVGITPHKYKKQQVSFITTSEE